MWSIRKYLLFLNCAFSPSSANTWEHCDTVQFVLDTLPQFSCHRTWKVMTYVWNGIWSSHWADTWATCITSFSFPLLDYENSCSVHVCFCVLRTVVGNSCKLWLIMQLREDGVGKRRPSNPNRITGTWITDFVCLWLSWPVLLYLSNQTLSLGNFSRQSLNYQCAQLRILC